MILYAEPMLNGRILLIPRTVDSADAEFRHRSSSSCASPLNLRCRHHDLYSPIPDFSYSRRPSLVDFASTFFLVAQGHLEISQLRHPRPII